MSLKVCCDFCDRPLPTVEYEEERMRYLFGEYAQISHTKEVNTHEMFPLAM